MSAWSEQFPTTPEPKYYTRRDPSMASDGKRIGLIAAATNTPFQPWQQYVADTATERDAFGQYRYNIVLVTVPRQSGKTTLVGPVQLDRVIMNPGIKAFYTAQTGKDARSRFNDLVNLVNASALAAVAQVRYSSGSENISFPNASSLNLFAPVMAALHGEHPPLVTLDEIWEYDEVLGDALLEGAILPAQLTLGRHRQVWMISTAGTALSVFMRKWVETGRKAGRSDMAYFEWSLRDGDDPYDPEAIARFHPAVGQFLNGHELTAANLLAIAGRNPDGSIPEGTEVMDHAQWLRGFCNIWTEAVDPLIPAEDWDALAAEPLAVPAVSDVVIAYEVALDNRSASVMAIWRDLDGTWCVRTLHTAPGIVWLVSFLDELITAWKPVDVAADHGGNTRRVTDELVRKGHKVTTAKGTDYALACDVLLTAALDEKNLRHDGSLTLSNGMAHLALVDRGDSRYFSRARSTGPINGPIAAAVGMWAYDHRTPAMPEAFIGY